jgi:NAD(P)H dehydrogenase (quinone)
MSQVKATIVYYSATGTIEQMARRLALAAEKAGAEVRLRHVAEIAPAEAIEENEQWQEHREDAADAPEPTPEDLTWADVVFFGTPTRFGAAASQLQAFIDTLGPTWQAGELADKVYVGFTSSQTEHGGQETTLLSLYAAIMHWGGILVTPGYTDPIKFQDGNPYGVSHVTGADNDAPLEDVQLEALDHLAERAIQVAAKLAA